jgi:hypothetical protein
MFLSVFALHMGEAQPFDTLRVEALSKNKLQHTTPV